MNTRYAIFVSHAAADKILAEQLKHTIAECLSLKPDRIFLTSDAVSMKTGQLSTEQITDAHRQATAIVALLTPRSVYRPWVLFECGGGHFHPRKTLHVVRSNGLSHGKLPDVFKDYHSGSIENAKGIRQLCLSLRENVGAAVFRSHPKVVARLISLASTSAGNWDLVDSTTLCTNVFDSPFSLEAILHPKSQFQAKRKLILFGLTLNFITDSGNSNRLRKAIWDWLTGNKARKFTAVVTALSKKGKSNELGLAPWRSVFGPIYERHLKRSTTVLKTWNSQAKKAGLKFEAVSIPFVPCSAMFVDPDEASGIAILQPVVYREIGTERPQFVVEKKHKQVFDYYWRAYEHYVSIGKQRL